MPWKEHDVVEKRFSLVKSYDAKEDTLSALCEQYGVSRQTGHKWVKRYQSEGLNGLVERSRAPHHRPRAVSQEVVERLLELRHAKKWGPGKLRDYLLRTEPEQCWPSVSTIAQILKEHNLVHKGKSRRRSPAHPGDLKVDPQANSVWGLDFKGWFLTGDGRRCDPLTVTDLHTRFLIGCDYVPRTDYSHVQPLLERYFREFGLPLAMRSDNGSPFASTAPGGLTRLSIWLIKLGIYPERIRPAHPQENGRHERFHRTLKAATATPPCATARHQQAAFNAFREEYNSERPHASLWGAPPGLLYTPSSRSFPSKLPEVEYDSGHTVLSVYDKGGFYFSGHHYFLTRRLSGQPVGLVAKDDRYWDVFFGMLLLGTLDTHKRTITRPKQKR